MDVFFYSRDHEPYGFLSNFCRAKQTVDGVEYPTNEHYYQSQKAKDIVDKDSIRSQPTPFLAMRLGRALPPSKMVENWDLKKVGIMREGLMAKFSQNPDLKTRLLATGDAHLHEDSPTDGFWGWKHGNGSDILGSLLEETREKLRC